MANWGQKVYPSDYAEIKALLKAEVGRRGKTEGTARGQSVGSMASYNGSAYDFSTQPTAGAYIKNEHIHHYAELCRAAQMKLKMAQEMVLSRHLGPQTSAGVQYRFDFVREEVVLLEATAN